MLRRIEFTRIIALLMLLLLFAFPLVGLAQEGGEGDEGDTTEETQETAAAAAEEGGSVSPLVPLGINQGFLIAQIVNFLVIFGILTVVFWRPLMNFLDNRSMTIAKGLEDANAAANARRNAEAEAEKILSQARSEAAQLVDEARGRGEEVAKSIEDEARKEAETIRTEARASAVAERNSELAGLRDQVTAISVAVANRLIGESLDAKKQKALIDDFFTRVPQGAASMSGNVEVISAMPLNDTEQKKIRDTVGGDDVTFIVDPAILGGLIIRSGDRVVDGSVRSNLNALSGRLN